MDPIRPESSASSSSSQEPDQTLRSLVHNIAVQQLQHFGEALAAVDGVLDDYEAIEIAAPAIWEDIREVMSAQGLPPEAKDILADQGAEAWRDAFIAEQQAQREDLDKIFTVLDEWTAQEGLTPEVREARIQLANSWRDHPDLLHAETLEFDAAIADVPICLHHFYNLKTVRFGYGLEPNRMILICLPARCRIVYEGFPQVDERYLARMVLRAAPIHQLSQRWCAWEQLGRPIAPGISSGESDGFNLFYLESPEEALELLRGEMRSRFLSGLDRWLEEGDADELDARSAIAQQLRADTEDPSWPSNVEQLNVQLSRITSLPPEIALLANLRNLDVSWSRLIEIPSLNGLVSLRTLQCTGCESLKRLNSLQGLFHLEILDLALCRALEWLPSFGDLESLEVLVIRGDGLRELPRLQGLRRLRDLSVLGCNALNELPSLQGLRRLRELTVTHCSSLVALLSLDDLPALRAIRVRECPSLDRLPSFDGLVSLQSVQIEGSSNLQVPRVPPAHQLQDRIEGIHARFLAEANSSIRSDQDADVARVVSRDNQSIVEVERVLGAVAQIQDIGLFLNNFMPASRLGQSDSEPSLAAVNPRQPQHIQGAPRPNIFELSEFDLENNPKDFLFDLGIEMELYRGTSPRGWDFQLRGPDNQAAAYDAGGVKRDVTYRLLQNLFKEDAAGLPHDNRAPAIIPKSTTDEDRKAYFHLGRVLSIPLTFSAPIGALFAKNFYLGLSKALQDLDLQADLPDARATLAAIAYNDPFAFALDESHIEQLSADGLDVLVDRLVEVGACAENEARACLVCISPSDRTLAAQESLAYLLSRHPQIGAWIEQGPSAISPDQLLEITPFLEHQDPELIPLLQGGLREAEEQFEELASSLRKQVAEINAKEEPTKADLIRKKDFEKRLQQAPKLELPEDLRARIEGALLRGAQERDDFNAVMATLRELELKIIHGLRIWRQTNEVLQEAGEAIQEIAKGIRDMLPGQAASSFSPERIISDLEGVSDAQTIQANCPLHHDYNNDDKAKKTHQWLMTWLEQASPEDLRGFCNFVTGAGALALQPQDGYPPLRVIFTNIPEDQLPIAHTCFRQLDLPKTYPDYETFKARLNTAIEFGSSFGFL